MLVRRSLAAVAAVMLALVAAGCQEAAPEPKMPDPTSSSSAPEPTETESPEPEAESPEEFIRRWAAVETEMENTGRTQEYRELSPRCDACQTLADTVERYYAADGYVNWGGWDIKSIDRDRSRGEHAFAVRVVSAPTEYRKSAAAPLEHFDGGPSTHMLRLTRKGGSWVVASKTEVPG